LDNPGLEVDVNVYELDLDGIESDARVWAARWVLFVCPEIRDVCRAGASDRLAIVHEGEQPDPARWLALLRSAGFALRRAA
jgi:hypothetical protein